MSDESVPSKTVTRPDDSVGSPGSKPVAGGRQTTVQAEITRAGRGGRADDERQREWGDTPSGKDPAMGGSSGGHSDRKQANPPLGGKKPA